MQEAVIREVLQAFGSRGIKIWLLGGWGIDALLGCVSRAHKDIDLIARLQDREAIRKAVSSLADSVVEDSDVKLLFFLNELRTDIIFFYALPDGTLVSDLDTDDRCVYAWPPGSFPEGPGGKLFDMPCRAITWEAQYVAKQGYSHFKKDAELREKDTKGLAVIRDHLPKGAEEELTRYFPGIPRPAQPP